MKIGYFVKRKRRRNGLLYIFSPKDKGWANEQTTIRVKFSDGTQIQSTFASTSAIQPVYAFVRNALKPEYASKTFNLCMSPLPLPYPLTNRATTTIHISRTPHSPTQEIYHFENNHPTCQLWVRERRSCGWVDGWKGREREFE